MKSHAAARHSGIVLGVSLFLAGAPSLPAQAPKPSAPATAPAAQAAAPAKVAPAAPAKSVAPMPAAAATPVASPATIVPAAAGVELEPPALVMGRDGKPTGLPAFKGPHITWPLERGWRQQLAAAVSMPSPSYGRGLALVAYVKAVEAATLAPEEKQTLIRAHVDELALMDFYALNSADVAFLRESRNDFIARYLSPAQSADLQRVRDSMSAASRDKKNTDFAGFPHGTGWAAPEFAAAARAQQAGDEVQRVQALRGAVAKGSPEAMRLIGECYREGKGVAADPQLALRWTHWAATRHHIPALRQLADYREKGIGLPADAAQARVWQSMARDIPPPVTSRPRVSFKAESHNFAAYLSGTWEVTIRFTGGKTLNTHFRFVASGTGFVLHYDERSPQPGSTTVWTTERQYASYDARTYKVLNFDFSGRRFEGHLNGGQLEGRFPNGTWTGTRRSDLDYAALAETAVRESRPEDALYYFTEAIAARRFELHFQRRGSVYYKLTDYESAIADLDVALGFNGKNEVSLTNRSLAHYAAGNHEAAITDANSALALVPAPRPDVRAIAVRTRALAHYKLGKYREAVDGFAEARRLNPAYPETREEMLAGYLLAGQAINESQNKMTQDMAKTADALKKANEEFMNRPVRPAENQPAPAATPPSKP